MDKQKRSRLYEIIAGICFILATISYSAGSGIVENALAQTAAGHASLGEGIFLEIINSTAVITIGAVLYMRLKQKSKAATLGYLISRIVEAVLLAIGGILTLSKIAQPMAVHNLLFNIAMIILGVYSIIFCLYLIKWSDRAKWLFSIGVAGYATLIIYAVINLAHPAQPAPMWLFGPGAVFEIIFPVWLIAKGFKFGQ